MSSHFDFDSVIARRHTGSVKWDHVFDNGVLVRRDENDPKHSAENLLALWVADMDFICPPKVIDAIRARVDHGIFGYSLPMQGYYDAISDWAAKRYGWRVAQESIVLSPGVVPVMNVVVRTFCKPGDQVLIQGPVYYHFMRAPNNHGVDFVSSDLLYDASRMDYSIDFDDFEAKAADPRTRMAMLCNPHNPTSRVWSADVLKRLADICVRHDVLIASDEIHCDLVFPGNRFTSIASLSDVIADNCITMMAASKTFNLAGLKTSHTIISNEKRRAEFVAGLQKIGLAGGNTFGAGCCA